VRKTRATRVSKPKPAVNVQAVPAAPLWVLKSAKPGMAWVAPPGSSEIRTVTVGDTLQGVGKVTAIAQDAAGRWVVSGTAGRINQ
jgi:intracellular multiplication protein IcmG